MRHNVIWGTPGASYSNQNIGIQLDEQIAGPASTTYVATVENNTILDVFNGIGVSNFYSRLPFIYQNTIQLQSANSSQVQYGIHLTNNSEPTVTYNTIGSTDKNNDDARAFFASQNILIDVGCNTEDTIGRGFEFADPQAGTYWHQNEMRYNQNGFVVGGNIGQQGNSGGGYGNQWLPAGSWTGPSARQTYTLSYDPLPGSTLYVNSNTAEWPTNNGPAFGTPYVYTGTLLSSSIWPVFSSLGSGVSCAVPPSYSPYYRMTGPRSSNNSFYRTALERVAQDSVSYGVHRGVHTWIAQRALYYSILADSTFADSSNILRSFFASAGGTRYAWLANIDQAIAAGKDSLATALLAKPPRAGAKAGAHRVMIRDLSTADGVVANFDTFYHFYFAWKNKAIDSAEEKALERFALKCPMLEGPAIYQARALLRMISGNIIIYKDTCLLQRVDEAHNDEGSSQRKWNEGKSINQQYSLVPNPNDGLIRLYQAVKDDRQVHIKVFNVLGAVVYSSEKHFDGRAAFLDLSAIVPGVYSMAIRDSNGDDYKLMFVKR